MKYPLANAVLVLAMTQQQTAFMQGNGDDLVNQAVAAQGGGNALRGLRGLAIKGDAKFWEPGQAFAAGGEERFLGDATFAITWDIADGRVCTARDRDLKYPDRVKMKYTARGAKQCAWLFDQERPVVLFLARWEM
jgi:hypothetical protein